MPLLTEVTTSLDGGNLWKTLQRNMLTANNIICKFRNWENQTTMSTGSEMMITPSIFYLSVLTWYGDNASTQLRRTFHNPNVLVTFRMRHVAKAKCILVTAICVPVCMSACRSVCPSPHSHTTAQSHMELGGMVGWCPLDVQCCATLQPVLLLWQHSTECKMSVSACTRSMAGCYKDMRVVKLCSSKILQFLTVGPS